MNLQNTGHRIPPEYEEGRLFSLLSPTRFTLLAVNLKDADSLSAQLANVLDPWRQLIVAVQVEPSKIEPKKKFREYFGTIPSLILIRPDAYIAFRGNEHSVTKLAEYLRHWLSPGAHQRAA